MNDHEQIGQSVQLEALPSERSMVRLETNSKGIVQVKIAVYAGETDAEMERLRLLAVKTYDALQEQLGARARFA